MSGNPGLSGSARPVTAAQKSAEGIVAGSPAKARTTDRASRTAMLMRTRRQNIQLELALEPAAKGEARSPDTQGTEARTARAEPERPAAGQRHPSPQAMPLNSVEPPCTDPYARWCGRGGAARLPPIPIRASALQGDTPPVPPLREQLWALRPALDDDVPAVDATLHAGRASSSRRVSLPCAVPRSAGEAANAGVLGSERIDQGRSPLPTPVSGDSEVSAPQRGCMDRRGVPAGCVHPCHRCCDAAVGDRTQAHRSAPASACRGSPVATERSAVWGAPRCRGTPRGTGRASKSLFGGCPPTRAAAAGRGARGRRVRRHATSRRSAEAGRGRVGGRCARRWRGPAACRRRGGCGCRRTPCG